jgi:hypothetical protein
MVTSPPEAISRASGLRGDSGGAGGTAVTGVAAGAVGTDGPAGACACGGAELGSRTLGGTAVEAPVMPGAGRQVTRLGTWPGVGGGFWIGSDWVTWVGSCAGFWPGVGGGFWIGSDWVTWAGACAAFWPGLGGEAWIGSDWVSCTRSGGVTWAWSGEEIQAPDVARRGPDGGIQAPDAARAGPVAGVLAGTDAGVRAALEVELAAGRERRGVGRGAVLSPAIAYSL